MAELHYSPPVVLTCSFLFIPACTAVLGLRLYAHHKQGTKLDWDGWTMLPAWLTVMALQVVMIVNFALKRIGYPDPYPLLGPLGARPNLGLWTFDVIDTVALGLTKISVMLFFRRIFGKRSPWLNIASLALVVICILWTLAFFFAWIFICRGHLDRFWQSVKIERANCVNTQVLHDSFAISDVVLDLAVVISPIPSLWALSMPRRKKLLVTGVFSLVAVTLLASIARLVIMVESVRVRYDPNIEYENLVTGAIYWGMIEAGLGFIAANLIVIHGSITAQLYKRFKNLSLSIFRVSSRRSNDSNLASNRSEEEGDRADSMSTRVEQPNDSNESVQPKRAPLYQKQGLNDVTLDESFCADLEKSTVSQPTTIADH